MKKKLTPKTTLPLSKKVVKFWSIVKMQLKNPGSIIKDVGLYRGRVPELTETCSNSNKRYLTYTLVKSQLIITELMSDYLLKDSESKRIFADWLKSMATGYAADSTLKWNDEDTLCEHFFSSIRGILSTPAGDLTIKSYKTRGRGPGAAEKKLGADGICIIKINTHNTSLEGFFLFQVKKAKLFSDPLRGARSECSKMLTHTAASYLLTLMPTEATMVGAMAVHSCKRNDPSLNDLPYVSFPRFAAHHILQGIMLEPLHLAHQILSPALSTEIKFVVGLIGETNNKITQAESLIRVELERLGLNIDING